MSDLDPLVIVKQEFIANGFGLLDNFTIKSPISVITGKNGSGKTRLLAHIAKNGIRYGKDLLEPQVRAFTREALKPHITGIFSVDQLKNMQRNFILEYERWKKDKFEVGELPAHMEGIITRPQAIKAAHYVATKLNKDYRELTHDEIEDHAPPLELDPFGGFELSELFNRWLYDFQVNRKNKGLALMGDGVKFLDDAEFLRHHGSPPWGVLNEIVNDIFDGKFQFSVPDTANRLYDYVPRLLEKGQSIEFGAISSGEQTILWLALILFQAQVQKTARPEKPSIFLFDEPDAFLHPQMVSKMYKAFETITQRFNLAIVLTTHSPTTVALAPEGALFNICNGSINAIAPDEAISDLLAGVPQIAIDPTKSRQVFVESQFDATIYQQIFTSIKSKLAPSIFLNFVSAGAKIPAESIKNVVRKHTKNLNEDLLTQIADEINGHGDCAKVIAQVESLIATGSRTTRGIIDWDNENKPGTHKHVHVLGHQLFYSIENWAIDPIGCIFLLNQISQEKYPLSRVRPDVKPSEWLGDINLLQATLDEFISDVYNHQNARSVDIKYVNGMVLRSDPVHTSPHGHDEVEKVVCARFGDLKAIAQTHRSKKLTCAIVDRFMVQRTEGDMIPDVVRSCLHDLQIIE